MRDVKQQVIGAGFAFFRATRLHRRLAPWTRGQGAILTFHHVRPFESGAFAPNRLLEIEPAFLDAALGRIRRAGFDLIAMDEAVRRIGAPGGRPFVALTFDDGYRDALVHALPILEKHAAPFTIYITTGFADRGARLWWVELEQAIRALDRVRLDLASTSLELDAGDDAAKASAFRTLYWLLRGGPERCLLDAIARLATEAGLDPAALVAERCLDWDEIRAMAHHPLCTIGVHTMTHPMLGKHDEAFVRHELVESRRLIEVATGLPARHLAYPVGDAASAGPREFALADELGFASAVTTRPGMIFPKHEAHRTALPRVSVNGTWQSLDNLEVLLTGVPFALWNCGQPIDQRGCAFRRRLPGHPRRAAPSSE